MAGPMRASASADIPTEPGLATGRPASSGAADCARAAGANAAATANTDAATRPTGIPAD